MKTSTTARAAALVASVLMTFASVHLIADHALPEAPAPTLAQAPSHA
jgi:hypothetical protein